MEKVIMGKDGKPMKAGRSVHFDTKVGATSALNVGDESEVSTRAGVSVYAAATETVLCDMNEKVQAEWEDHEVHAMKTSITSVVGDTGDAEINVGVQSSKKSFVNVVNSERHVSKLNFKKLFNTDQEEEGSDFVLPMEAINTIQYWFINTLVGFFVEKSVAFPLVQNYVSNTWGKFGFQKVMRDDGGFFYFKFTSLSGVEQVLQQGPWMIRNTPLVLNKWMPNLSLSKEGVSKVPVWVKMHKVTVVAYSEDGLSLIASQIG
ncbi:retrovirus-related pol polyprotein from transposon TNT 1-94 [Tanacetum coccineum]|uniref:Retrovirus-related pol polyprotein from transposon TNT 1-94 n=1 Tax=Tanacetum coccineum TaxID=301880 RepID=A0ABQ5ESP2_9ASTR